jgi:hypothetical protein
MLLGFFAPDLQGVLLLDRRVDSSQGLVLLVSVKSEGSMIELETKWLE